MTSKVVAEEEVAASVMGTATVKGMERARVMEKAKVKVTAMGWMSLYCGHGCAGDGVLPKQRRPALPASYRIVWFAPVLWFGQQAPSLARARPNSRT